MYECFERVLEVCVFLFAVMLTRKPREEKKEKNNNCGSLHHEEYECFERVI